MKELAISRGMGLPSRDLMNRKEEEEEEIWKELKSKSSSLTILCTTFPFSCSLHFVAGTFSVVSFPSKSLFRYICCETDFVPTTAAAAIKSTMQFASH